jgi:hypothetical protein
MRWIALAMTCAVSTANADSSLTRRHAITTTASRTELPAPARMIDPAVARAVLAPRLIDRASVVERTSTWIEPEKPPDRKPWRPRIMPLPMSSPTGGSGVKLKIRF